MSKIYSFLSLVVLLVACGHSREAYKENSTSEGSERTENVNVDYEVMNESIDETKITWLDFETAIDKNKKQKKFIFIDIYTDWCGWCKKMDASTFTDKEVIKYINTHFYAVKMDAESKDPIAYKGNLYEYKQYSAKTGYNALAVSLLDSKMSFPSFVVLNKKEIKKGKIAGYKTPQALLQVLKQYVGN